MEELRSTEILDKEIQNDARRKAGKILKNADAECEKISAEVNNRIEAARAEKTEFFRKRLEEHMRDVDSVIPLEKQRARALFVDKAVSEALDAYLASLSEEKKLELIKKKLAVYAEILPENSDPSAIYSGFSEDGVKRIVKECFGDTVASFEKAADNAFEGVVIETSAKDIRCKATLAEIRAELCRTKRFELQQSLFGGNLKE